MNAFCENNFKEINEKELKELFKKYNIFKVNTHSSAYESNSLIIFEGFQKISDIYNLEDDNYKLMIPFELKEYIIDNNIKNILVFKNMLPMMEEEGIISELVSKSIINNSEGTLMYESIRKYPDNKVFTFERVDYTINIRLH